MQLRDWYQQRASFYFSASPTLRGGIYLLLLLGVVGLAGGMMAGEHTRTWGSVLFNVFFFFSIALGGVAFGGMQDVIGATWGRPVKRLHELLSSFVPVAAVIMIGFLLALKFDLWDARAVYRWMVKPEILEHTRGKKIWLQIDFMVARDIVAVLIIWALSQWHMGKTLRRDRLLVAGKLDEAQRVGAEDQASLRYWSAPVLVGYALCYSLLCFDLTMSLAPTWFSTLWAGWSFSIMMQTLFALTLIFMYALRSTPTGYYFKRQQFHDLGKLLHGFTVFFAYLTFSHVLTYWYTNIPEETSYFITRLEKPWLYLVLILPLFNFVLPLFAFIPKISKWVSLITIPLAVLILLSQWFTYGLVVMPEILTVTDVYLPWIEVAGGCFFFGLFLLAFVSAARRVPLLSLADPLLSAAVDGEHH